MDKKRINPVKHYSPAILLKAKFNRAKNQSVTLIIVLAVIGSILTGLLLVAQIIIRYSQAIRGIEVSEKAYFAAESAVEIASYDILKNYKDYSTYSLSGTLGEDTEYEVDTISLDSDCPSSSECTLGQPISNTNPWSISLSPGQSFQLNLDINGASYPASLSIARNPNQPSEVVFSRAAKTDPPLSWNQTTYSSWPVNLTLDSSNYYYRLRINNLGNTDDPDVTYTITPITPSSELVIGLEVRAKGIYPTPFGSYERRTFTDFPAYQKF